MNRYLPPLVLQLLGVVIIVAGVVFYFLTLHANAYIFSLGFGLATLGAAQDLLRSGMRDLEPGDEEQPERKRRVRKKRGPTA